jgi:hypothetical protein
MDTVTRPVKLTAKERHALAELAKPLDQRDYTHVHGHTIHALQRKRLFRTNSRPGGKVTPAGRAALVVPNIFDDLFPKETIVPKLQKTRAAVSDEFRPIEFVETSLHDPVRERWEAGADTAGVRLYCTSSPLTHGAENGRWSLQIFARVKTKRGGVGKHFAGSTASMAREDLLWLRAMIDGALRKVRKVRSR